MDQSTTGSVDPVEDAWRTIISANKTLNLGPFFLGQMFDVAMWGIMIVQFYAWSTRHAHRGNERLFNKITMYWLTAFGTLFTVIDTCWIWDLFVTNYGRYSAFSSLKYIGWYPLMTSGVAVPSQFFYLDRAQSLSKTIWLPVVCISLTLASLALAIVNRVQLWDMDSYDADSGERVTYSWIATTVAVDVIITVRILYVLVKKRSGEASADRFVTRLIRLCLESQTPPTLLAIALVLVTAIWPHSTIDTMIILITSKVYILPLFALINSRRTIQRQMNLTLHDTTVSPEDTSGVLASEPVQSLDSAAGSIPNELATEADKEELPYHLKEQQSMV